MCSPSAHLRCLLPCSLPLIFAVFKLGFLIFREFLEYHMALSVLSTQVKESSKFFSWIKDPRFGLLKFDGLGFDVKTGIWP